MTPTSASHNDKYHHLTNRMYAELKKEHTREEVDALVRDEIAQQRQEIWQEVSDLWQKGQFTTDVLAEKLRGSR